MHELNQDTTSILLDYKGSFAMALGFHLNDIHITQNTILEASGDKLFSEADYLLSAYDTDSWTGFETLNRLLTAFLYRFEHMNDGIKYSRIFEDDDSVHVTTGDGFKHELKFEIESSGAITISYSTVKDYEANLNMLIETMYTDKAGWLSVTYVDSIPGEIMSGKSTIRYVDNGGHLDYTIEKGGDWTRHTRSQREYVAEEFPRLNDYYHTAVNLDHMGVGRINYIWPQNRLRFFTEVTRDDDVFTLTSVHTAPGQEDERGPSATVRRFSNFRGFDIGKMTVSYVCGARRLVIKHQ